MLTKKEQFDVDLPEHVVLNILFRLPVKSLIRFTCVSKRWHSLIVSDHQFGNSHFQLASHPSQNVLISTCIETTLGPSTRFQSLDDNFSIRNLTCPSESNSHIVVMGSCNGLVVSGKVVRGVVGESYSDVLQGLVIWNPSSGFFRRIPSPSFWIGMGNVADENNKWCINCVFYGFGQVSTPDDYKLVVIPNFDGFMEVLVFSVSGNCWKVVRDPFLSPYRLWTHERGTHSNGAIHWVNYCERDNFELCVYVFDLASEEFREMALPVRGRNEDGMKARHIRTAALLGGCLCVIFQDSDESSEFWVMKEYGVSESWFKLFWLDFRDLPNVLAPFFNCYLWDPIFIAEDGTVVIKLLDQKKLLRIKCHKDEDPVCTDWYSLEEVPGYICLFDAISYDETLVSLLNDNGDSSGFGPKSLEN